METIRLHNTFGSVLMTRNAVEDFFTSLAHNPIILDFSNVEFISRSAAHEYIRQKASFPFAIKEVNMSQNVKAMFVLVAKQLKRVAA